MTNYLDIIAARATINRLTTHTDECDTTSTFRPEDAHDIADAMLRDILMIDDDEPIDETTFEIQYYRDNYDIDNLDIDALYTELADAFTLTRTDPYSIDFLSRARLDQSLCPLHRCDYAICFDDADIECALIRDLFPTHDT